MVKQLVLTNKILTMDKLIEETIEKIEYEITTNASAVYIRDTIRKEVERENINVKKNGDDDKIISQEIDIILKRKIKNK